MRSLHVILLADAHFWLKLNLCTIAEEPAWLDIGIIKILLVTVADDHFRGDSSFL